MDEPQVGYYTDSDVVPEFLSREELTPLVELVTSCPGHFLRTKVKPLVVDLPTIASVEEIKARLVELHEAYRPDCQVYYDRNSLPESPAIRGADPAIVLIPGVGIPADRCTAAVGKQLEPVRACGWPAK